MRIIGSNNLPPLLMIHGFMGDSNDWNESAEILKEKHHIILIDLPGHGVNSNLKLTSFSEISTFINNHLQVYDEFPINVLGYSMGGRCALYWALQNPSRVSKLLLESVNPGLEFNSEKEIRANSDKLLFSEVQNRFDLKEFFDNWYSDPIFNNINQNPKFKEILKSKLNIENVSGWEQAILTLSIGNQPSLWKDLVRLSFRTKFITGEFDDKYQIIGNTINKLNPNIEFELVKNSGHNTHFENADSFTNICNNFFKEQ